MNNGRFTRFRGLHTIVKKTLQIRFFSPFPKQIFQNRRKQPPSRCDFAPPPANNRRVRGVSLQSEKGLGYTEVFVHIIIDYH